MEQKRQDKLARALGEALASRRAERGLTQEEMAALMGIGPEAVSRIERGVVLPTLPRLYDFALALDCGLTELISDASDDPADQASTIARKLANLAPDDRETVLAVVATLSTRLARRPAR